MQKKVILFDLDGTLTDPKIGITRSVQYALKHFGIEIDDPDVLTPFIGPPLGESFEKFYGLSEIQAKGAIAKYREYFGDRGLFENSVYDGVPEMLEGLSGGKTLMVATSKPTYFAEKILAHFGLDSYFTHIIGSEMDGRRTDKAEVIAYCLAQFPCEKNDAVMIGDREHDIIGAKKMGVESIGVLYGYGCREELEAAGAGRIAADVETLSRLLSTDA